jgi:cytochrome b561
MTIANMHDMPAQVAVGRQAMRSYTTTARVLHWLTVVLVVFMVSSAVIAKQLNDGPWSDTLFMMHKTTGIVTLVLVLMRVCYRVLQWWKASSRPAQGRPMLHWLLYAVVIMVPLLGWAGISDFGAREIFPGFTLPAIWPERAGYDDLLFSVHAYLAFSLLAFVALHIGFAMQDYMMRADDPNERN